MAVLRYFSVVPRGEIFKNKVFNELKTLGIGV